ncbi:phosphoribosyltransferase [Mycolicibacterium goodii]|uniref:Phosphoribosyltransferase n=1 Tax=Mycolicibacterium goodii TaxID=134601 RepID=A0ABS6HMS3_MYCGD|nr:phosphoribosyltransferase [Mycolicibacterium goodii]MBU8823920.1 phosphoribosyltransferase [Mycolicibacterium goodii]MBU8836565.1 phosphoribosyltransferase [Mycolicibacterium goodii]
MSAWSVGHGAIRTFQDRREAGRVLAQRLTSYRGEPDVLVLGLPRGGVPIAWEVASHLHAPLDVFLVRKLGVPQWQELAMGAVASGGGVVFNEKLMDRLGISDEDMAETLRRETIELERRERAYRGDRGPMRISGKTVILVDDGIATGASMMAAVRAVRRDAHRVVVAVPVGPAGVCRELAAEVHEVVCASMPQDFEAVGQAFADFHQVTDDEVRQLLATPTTNPV